MYKVMIVDDEALTRIGIKSLIDWTLIDCEVVALASNGEDALNQLKTVQVDIIITDIKMPKMDGILFIQKVKEQNPDIHIVVLSNYDEFPLVKETFHLGIEDYLLKFDINSETLYRLMEKIITTINQKKKKSIHSEKERRMKETAIKTFFARALDGLIPSSTDLQEYFSYIGYQKEQNFYFIHTTQIEKDSLDKKYVQGQEKAVLDFWIENILNEVISEAFSCFSFQHSEFLFVNICMLPTGEGSEKDFHHFESAHRNDARLKMTNKRIRNLLFLYTGVQSHTGISCLSNDILQFSPLFQESLENIYSQQYASSLPTTDNGKLIKEVLSYIHKNLDKNIRMSETAGLFHMSNNYFSKIFRQVTGEGFVDYVARVKIEEAIKLLKTQKYKTNEVAQLLGFSNSFYFSRVFKNVTGKAPTEFL